MNRNVSAQISYDRLNKGVDTRFPSTANFLVDSNDRPNTISTTASNFTITKANSLFNGFFTRFALTEMVLTWMIPNISATAGNNLVFVNAAAGAKTITIPDGFYNVKQCLDTLLAKLNAATPGGFGAGYFGLRNSTTFAGVQELYTTNSTAFWFSSGTSVTYGTVLAGLAEALSIPTYTSSPGGAVPTAYSIISPNIVPYDYIDIVSPQLTAQQDLKDSSTSQTSPDVIYRWVFADDAPQGVDAYDYPILQSYKAFKLRRYLSFPKQIRWDPLSPLGQVQFQILNNAGEELEYNYYRQGGGAVDVAAGAERVEFNMLLLVSEV